MPEPPSVPTGFTAFGGFLIFASAMASLAAFLLLVPGTILDHAWSLNPRAHQQLAPLAPWIAYAFLFLSALLIYTARLWFQHRFHGWRVAVAIIALQSIGEAVNFIRGELLTGVIGLLIASALLSYLFSRRVRAAFR